VRENKSTTEKHRRESHIESSRRRDRKNVYPHAETKRHEETERETERKSDTHTKTHTHEQRARLRKRMRDKETAYKGEKERYGET